MCGSMKCPRKFRPRWRRKTCNPSCSGFHWECLHGHEEKLASLRGVYTATFASCTPSSLGEPRCTYVYSPWVAADRRALAPLICNSSVPRFSCMDLLLICGARAASLVAPYTVTYLSLDARMCICMPAYPCICMVHASVPASWLGLHSRKPQYASCVLLSS